MLSKNECWCFPRLPHHRHWPVGAIRWSSEASIAGFSMGTLKPMASFCSTKSDAFLYRLSWYFSYTALWCFWQAPRSSRA